MGKINKDFDKMFGVSKNVKSTEITNIDEDKKETISKEDLSIKEMVETDFNLARDTYLDGIRQIRGHIDNAREFAEEAETARSIEVFYNLVKTSADMSKDLMDLHLKKIKINDDINTKKKDSPVTNNNNLFVGSTKELQELLANNNKDTNK